MTDESIVRHIAQWQVALEQADARAARARAAGVEHPVDEQISANCGVLIAELRAEATRRRTQKPRLSVAEASYRRLMGVTAE